jgi:acetylornithine deacetylase/succinyl-diaminopimelate desuccinylase-like protein
MSKTACATQAVATDPVPLLQRLIRFQSVNPPGGEGPCVRYVADLLRDADVSVRLLAADPARPNLVARLPGRGVSPPLLLHAHADVVPAAGQDWAHPPFGGDLINGHVWGRGAIDMKGPLAMMISAMLRFRAEDTRPAGDVLLALSPDEETGSDVGAHYLVREHPELLTGVHNAIGEDGGAGFSSGGRRVHPIVVAEKRACWLRATLRGPGGHGSRQGHAATAMAKLARMLVALSESRLPMHLTPAVDEMLAELASASPGPLAIRLQALRTDPAASVPYDLLPEGDARYLDSVLRNTVNATIVRTSDKINIVPSLITVDLDGRILPGGWAVDDYLTELRALIGDEPQLDVLLEGEPMPAAVLGPFYQLLAGVLRRADPAGLPLPMLTTASTDARLFASLGITCYGWLPLLAPTGARYQDTLHAANERIPVAGLRSGADCIYQVLASSVS